MSAPSPSQAYYIASLNHTSKSHEHITFWGPDYRGYVLAIVPGHVGSYTAEYIAADGHHLSNGESCLAVPKEVVESLLSPQPYFRNGRGVAAQFYDTPGPVVDNTRENWKRLIAAALPVRPGLKLKPEWFRGTRRSFAIAGIEAAQTKEASYV
jgi:hypothetical protein